MPVNNHHLIEVLLEKKLIDKKTSDELAKKAEEKKVFLEDLLFEMEIIPDEKLGEVIATIHEVPFTKISDKTIPETLLRIVPYNLAANQFIIPFGQKENELSVAINNPQNYELIASLEKKTGLTVKPYYATKKDIKATLKFYNRDVNAKFTKLLKGALTDPQKIESLKDAAKILDTVILFAFQNNASDIHIEPHREFITVRYRIDGLLRTIAEFPLDILDLLTTRVKVLANLRTDEHMSAQDGRFKIDLENNEITLRVSILPTYDGEKTVMRLLSSTIQELNIESLGFSEQILKIIQNNILKTHGIILVTGPTGSGKTTTLYSILKLLNSPEVNISTIEDPVEYRLPGINQIQVNEKTNLTFAKGLRSILRQDPDILMVGEIRDEETAGIAVNAALTGHLVLATLHTNDVASTLPRLLDMGIEPFLVASTTKMVMAQRLVRKICQKCREAMPLSIEQVDSLAQKFNLKIDIQKIIRELTKEEKIIFYKGKGCESCGNSGYKGRSSIAEAMEVTENIRKKIFSGSSSQEIEEIAKNEGMIPMFTDGIKKVLNGETTIEEVLRVMRS